MRRFNRPIFDEVLETDAQRTSVDAYTSTHLNDLLGQYDQLALQPFAHVLHASGVTPTVQLVLETSCDGSHWVEKQPPAPASPLNAPLSWLYDDGARPSFALVRVRVRLACARPATARLVVHATARDQGGVTHRLQKPRGYHPISDFSYHVVTDQERALQQQLGTKQPCRPEWGENCHPVKDD